jgi:hypothetical protein
MNSGPGTLSGTGAEAGHDRRTLHASMDPAKALVMCSIAELVNRGRAQWSTLESGDVELRLPSGEIFVLGDQTVTRIA